VSLLPRWLVALILAAFAGRAWAPDILGAFYDARRDQIVVEIAYLGVRPDHDLTVNWGKCKSGGV